MATRTRSRMSAKERKKWNAIKLAVGLFAAFFLLIALIGALAHAQFNATNFAPSQDNNSAADKSSDLQAAKGCVGTDQTTGKTFIDIRCIQDPKINQVMCDNRHVAFRGTTNATCPNTTVPHDIAGINQTR